MQAYWWVVRILLTPPAEATASQKWKIIYLQVLSYNSRGEAIKTLAVRGAPAIGVCAAYGLALGMQKLAAGDDLKRGLACLVESCEYLASSRPTAVNLFWAMDRVKRSAEEFIAAEPGVN